MKQLNKYEGGDIVRYMDVSFYVDDYHINGKHINLFLHINHKRRKSFIFDRKEYDLRIPQRYSLDKIMFEQSSSIVIKY